MGFKPWRNLGILTLAGVSLVGCATPQTSKLVTPTTPTQNNSWNTQPGQAPPAPNPAVFGGNQQLVPSANGGFDNQQRPNMQGLPQNSGPANPNQGFNTSSGAQNFNGSNTPPPSSPANSSYLTVPNGGSQQSFNNSGFQGNNGTIGATVSQTGYGFPQGGAPTPSLPQAPTGFTPPSPGAVMQIPAPSGFGTNRQ